MLRHQQTINLSLLHFKKYYLTFSNARNFHTTNRAFLRRISSSKRPYPEIRTEIEEHAVAGNFEAPPVRKTFDNFYGIESDEGVIYTSAQPSPSKPANDSFISSFVSKNLTEKFKKTSFGNMRLDSENKLFIHGQFDENTEGSDYYDTRTANRSRKIKMEHNSNTMPSAVQSNYSNTEGQNDIQSQNNASAPINNATSHTDIQQKGYKDAIQAQHVETHIDDSFIDESYFPNTLLETEDESIEQESYTFTKESVNYIEECYFGDGSVKENFDNDIKLPSINDISEVESALHSDSSKPNTLLETKDESIVLKSYPFTKEGVNYIDECYFGDGPVKENFDKDIKLPSINDVSEVESALHSNSSKPVLAEENLSYIDESFFTSKIVYENIETNSHVFKSASEIRSEPKKRVANATKYNLFNERSKSNIDECFISEDLTPKLTDYNVKHDSEDTNVSGDNINNSKVAENIQSSEIDRVTKEKLVDKSENVKCKDNYLSYCNGDPQSLNSLSEEHSYVSCELNLPISNSSLRSHSDKNKFSYNTALKEQPNPAQNLHLRLTENLTMVKSMSNLDHGTSKEVNVSKSIKTADKKDVTDKKQNPDDQPETAHDFAKKLRGEKAATYHEKISGFSSSTTEKFDSKGFRILKNQVPELKYFTRDEIVELLVENVLYSDDDLIVLNKPYNLVMHESKTTKDACLSNYLDDLAGELDKSSRNPKLFTVHRLDKETTGCLLLARNEAAAQNLKRLFFQRQIVKTYWIVTIRVPESPSGIIDIPIAEGLIDKRARMVLSPDLSKDIPYRSHSKRGKNAVTHYSVIAESGSAALIEVKPETGVKHQIRVHFGFGLGCPILGDHKYTYPDKLVPQKLSSDMLHKLHVRQSKVRHIPMHIYARSIFIPQYSEGRNLFVMAPMPIHISKNLQKLKFRRK